MDAESAQENDQSLSDKNGDDVVALSKAAKIRMKLRIVANYVVDGFVPFVAVAALIVAVMALNGNKSGQAMVGQSASKLDSMNTNLTASLTAAKNELEKLKGSLVKEKSMQDEERKKLDDKISKIIQSISQLQVKSKISPTLEEQVSQSAIKNLVTATPVQQPVKADTPVSSVSKPVAQTKILKEAIDKFNKK